MKNNVFLIKPNLNKQIFEYSFFYEPEYSNATFLENAHP